MRPIVTVIAPGAMGSGIAGRLVERGVEVRTVLDGRSAASAQRARDAGMAAVAPERAVEAEFILSIVPPASARSLAERLAPALTAAKRKPVFVDCNAVSPQTIEQIAAVVMPTGAPFVDAAIIGGPPKPGAPGPAIYAAGEAAPRLGVLAGHGLDVRVLNGPVGAASALKMCYAGITKGLAALGTAMILAAARSGADGALRDELAASQPALLAFLAKSVPGMFPKAYRWVAEMEEIAAFSGEQQIYEGAARLFERIAADAGNETTTLRRFLG